MSQLMEMSKLTEMLLKKYNNIIGVEYTKDMPPEKIIAHIISYYENIIDCMPGNVYWMSRDCLTLGCNKNVLDMFGFKTAEEFKGLSFEEMGKIGQWSKEATLSFKQDTFKSIHYSTTKSIPR